jgi:hypothetical protein
MIGGVISANSVANGIHRAGTQIEGFPLPGALAGPIDTALVNIATPPTRVPDPGNRSGRAMLSRLSANLSLGGRDFVRELPSSVISRTQDRWNRAVNVRFAS